MPEIVIPPGLDFIAHQLRSPSQPLHRRARFLKTAFDANDWELVFGDKSSISFTFDVRLGKGRLTDPRHRRLLETFKSWICVQDHPQTNRGGNLAPVSMYARVSCVLHLIDYLLVNYVALGLEEHGLATLTESDIRTLFKRLAGARDVNEAVYRWSEKLGVYLRSRGSAMSPDKLAEALRECPRIADDLPPDGEGQLGLSSGEIISARAFLWSEGLLTDRHSSGYIINSCQIAKRILKNTLRGFNEKSTPPELIFGEYGAFRREYPLSPSKDYDDKPRNDKSLRRYYLALKSLALVPTTTLQADPSVIPNWDGPAMVAAFGASATGRTKTAPPPVVLKGLRSAIDFIFDYGNGIVDSYLAVANAAVSERKSCQSYAYARPIASHLTPEIMELNVVEWIVEPSPLTARPTAAEYFARVRSAPTLSELLRVLVGACVVVVSTLMARRQGELTELTAGAALDESRRYLVFFNRKSGVLGLRERELRPIPSVAVFAIELLERMHKSASELGLVSTGASLFQAPGASGEISGSATHRTLYGAVDLFCDYFELDLDPQGRRFYLRIHQLRRFSAMMFFWHAGFGQMDTLRWFLAHTDIEHLYRYILEITPGGVIRSIKADSAAACISDGDQQAAALRKLVLAHFGVANTSLVDSDELTEYLDDLLKAGEMSVEPIFFCDGGFQRFRVAIKVTPKVAS